MIRAFLPRGGRPTSWTIAGGDDGAAASYVYEGASIERFARLERSWGRVLDVGPRARSPYATVHEYAQVQNWICITSGPALTQFFFFSWGGGSYEASVLFITYGHEKDNLWP